MVTGWRRKVVAELQADPRLHPGMIVVSPEPESGTWADIDNDDPQTKLEAVRDKQMPWELQYLNLCDITAFWLPTYWTEGAAGPFAGNIGPTSRWEFGYFLQEYLRQPQLRRFIVGAPEDAESVKWAKKISSIHGLEWHTLPSVDKEMLVAPSFVSAIADALAENDWTF
jgi:hypothetical protein